MQFMCAYKPGIHLPLIAYEILGNFSGKNRKILPVFHKQLKANECPVYVCLHMNCMFALLYGQWADQKPENTASIS
jgi:hypothetical protein